MIKYIGSKRALLPWIGRIVDRIPDVRTVVDLFAGTSRVGHALKARGYQVLANDHNAYAATLARCYVQADRDDVLADAGILIDEFNRLPGRPGFFTENWCERSRFFQPKNGARIDAIRDAIAARDLPPELEAVLIVSLLQAADKVDSTTGVQMAYLKQWSPRSHNDLELRMPDVLPRARHGKAEAHCREAVDAARELVGDVVYLDPPYNKHSYLGNYHIWESLVRWDRMPVYGIAMKRADCVPRRSPFNLRRHIDAALTAVLTATQARVVIVSFNNEGFIPRARMEAMLRNLWGGTAHVLTLPFDHKRYVGARIGIYNDKGEKVGKVSHLTNTEYLYVAARESLHGELASLLTTTTASGIPSCATS
ncbi:MAG: DNA adenine methylase [Planctomycetes bacterium]|nr:DNA adenine methylase [Planctomycetota bacterium]